MRAKYLIIIPIFLLTGFFNHVISQNAIISGYVLGLNNNIGVPNHQVEILSTFDTVTSTGLNYYNNLFTYQNGYFVDSISIPAGQIVKFLIKVKDCQNNQFIDTFFSNTTSPIVFHICDTNNIQCYAQFVAYPDSSNYKNINFFNLSSSNTQIYFWTFGDGSNTNAINPVHTYTYSGTYQVCLTSTDTTTNCSHTFCDTLIVSPTTSCNNNFNYTNNNLTVSFFGSCSSTLPTIYKWEFGDQTSASGQNPSHMYSFAGIYNVCLRTISINPTTLDTCMVTKCKLIAVNSPQIGNIYGQVFADSSMVRHCKVYIYKQNPTNSTYQLKDSTNIITNDSLGISYYYFQNFHYGTYLTHAELLTSDSLHGIFAPTYYGNNFQWSNSTPFNHNSPAGNYPINLTRINTPNGACSVSGRILSADNKGFGDPIPNIKVFIYDSQHNVYGYTITNTNGEYSFSNLGYEVYYVHAEIMNVPVMPTYISPNTNNPNLQNIDIFIGHYNGMIEAGNEIAGFDLFPTIADNFLNTNINSSGNLNSELNIYSPSGELVFSRGLKLIKGANDFRIDISNLPEGLYFISFNSGNFNARRKFFVTR